jgi:hypothetical protein
LKAVLGGDGNGGAVGDGEVVDESDVDEACYGGEERGW